MAKVTKQALIDEADKLCLELKELNSNIDTTYCVLGKVLANLKTPGFQDVADILQESITKHEGIRIEKLTRLVELKKEMESRKINFIIRYGLEEMMDEMGLLDEPVENQETVEA